MCWWCQVGKWAWAYNQFIHLLWCNFFGFCIKFSVTLALNIVLLHMYHHYGLFISILKPFKIKNMVLHKKVLPRYNIYWYKGNL